MEEFPRPPSTNLENKAEKILTSEEILQVFSQHEESFTVTNEKSDEDGIYFYVAEAKGEKEGDTIEYHYTRKGTHPNNNEASETCITRVEYQDGVPVNGERIAILNEETGEWEKL